MANEITNGNMNESEEELVITVNTVDGGTMDCTVLTTFKSEGREYIALMPHDDSKQIQLFRYATIEDNGTEGIEIAAILSDMEFDAALKVFQSLVVTDDEPTE
jgi:uncharacterized protein YrzB (UPF0473 family)